MLRLWKNKPDHFDYAELGADMHSHLIPGIDDGAEDIQASLQLIKGLADLGYKKIITTPHIMQDMYLNTHQDIIQRFDLLKKAISETGMDIELRVAAEYFVDDNLKQLLEKKVPLLTIADNIVLVEFSLASYPFDLKEILFEMQLQDYQPLIAHPERYLYPEQGRAFFDELRSAGYLLQLNILSLTGVYGKEVQKQAHYLLGKQYYDYAGTDLHHLRHLDALYNPSLKSPLKKLLKSGMIKNMEL